MGLFPSGLPSFIGQASPGLAENVHATAGNPSARVSGKVSVLREGTSLRVKNVGTPRNFALANVSKDQVPGKVAFSPRESFSRMSRRCLHGSAQQDLKSIHEQETDPPRRHGIETGGNPYSPRNARRQAARTGIDRALGCWLLTKNLSHKSTPAVLLALRVTSGLPVTRE